MTHDGVALLIFCRKPVPGVVKTRLIPVLGAEGAAELQRCLLLRALATAVGAGAGTIELHCAPDCDNDFLRDCSRQHHIMLLPQSNGDLGERMAHAMEHALLRYTGVVLMGSDVPSLTVDDLRNAMTAAQAGRVVLAPAEDGGYVLIGLSRRQRSRGPLRRYFAGIPWGHDNVMQVTRQRLTELGEEWEELATRWDVDRPGDLPRLQGLVTLPSVSS